MAVGGVVGPVVGAVGGGVVASRPNLVLVVRAVVGGGCCSGLVARRRPGWCRPVRGDQEHDEYDHGRGWRDRLALAVLTQYRVGTTGQLHRVLVPCVRIEQTRRRLVKLRGEGLVDRVTLPQAGRLRAWFPTAYGVRVAWSGRS